MLTEDQVVDATMEWLKRQGWTIDSCCHGTSQGDDIRAVNDHGETLFVECKGGLSPNNFQPFSINYVWTCLSGALFKTARKVEESTPVQLQAMAFPNTKTFRERFDVLKDFCERNRIHVFWVELQGVVEIWQPNKSFKADDVSPGLNSNVCFCNTNG